MNRNYFIIRLSILLIFTGFITGGICDGRWHWVGPAEAGNSPAPIGRAIDGGTGNEIPPPPGDPKPGYQWVLRRVTTYKSTIVQDGYKMERQPRYIEKYRQIGWKEKKVAVYNTVTENEGWEYYTVEVPVYKTVSYVKGYKPEAVLRNGVLVIEKRPIYGSKRIQIGSRKETRRRPRWVTHKVFSRWKTVKEPEYGWVMEQDGWEEPKLVPNYVSKTVPSTTWVWRQEPLPWEPGTTPDWLPEPDWLTNKECPPWIPETLWDLMSLEDRQAILQGARGVWEKAIVERISSVEPLGQEQARELFESHQLWGEFPRKMWVPGFNVPLHLDFTAGEEASDRLANWDIVYWTGEIHINEDGSVWYYISEKPVGGSRAGWVDSRDLDFYVHSALNDSTIDYWLQEYRTQLGGSWESRDKQAVAEGVMAVGRKLASIIGGTPQEAFASVFGNIEFYRGNDRSGLTSECSSITVGACTSNAHLINFMSMAQPTTYRSEELAYALARNNVIHELGHAFANLWWANDPATGKTEYAPDGPYEILKQWDNRNMLSNDGFHPSPISGRLLWRQHPEDQPTGNEVFADMFLGWVFDTWADDPSGEDRDAFMAARMQAWLEDSANP
jgi:hypothetical protein